jgi:hypothetical protein
MAAAPSATSRTSPGHDLLYTSSDLSRLDFPDEISFFDVTPRAQNAMMYDTL